MKWGMYRISIIAIVVQVAVALYIGAALPDDARIPAHWNIFGEIDRYAGKSEGVYLFLGLNIFLLLMFAFLPAQLAKKNRKYREALHIMPLMANILIPFFACFHLFTLMLAIHPGFGYIPLVMGILVGALFIAIGRILPTMPFVTTIPIDPRRYDRWKDYWERVSRFMGWCYTGGGVLFIVSGTLQQFIDPRIGFMNVVIVFVLAMPILYSLFLFIAKRYN